MIASKKREAGQRAGEPDALGSEVTGNSILGPVVFPKSARPVEIGEIFQTVQMPGSVRTQKEPYRTSLVILKQSSFLFRFDRALNEAPSALEFLPGERGTRPCTVDHETGMCGKIGRDTLEALPRCVVILPLWSDRLEINPHRPFLGLNKEVYGLCGSCKPGLVPQPILIANMLQDRVRSGEFIAIMNYRQERPARFPAPDGGLKSSGEHVSIGKTWIGDQLR